MSPFDYISVVLAVVVGLGLSHLLLGIVEMLRHRGRMRFYWIHSIWIALTFISIVYLWWTIWNFRKLASWNFFSFLLLLLQPVLLFIAAAFVVPAGGESESDMSAFYYRNRRGIFGTFAAFLALVIVQNSILNHSPLIVANAYLAGAFALIAAAAMTPRRAYHATVAVIFVVWMVAFISHFGLLLQFS
jgi:hypothetical protein